MRGKESDSATRKVAKRGTRNGDRRAVHLEAPRTRRTSMRTYTFTPREPHEVQRHQ